MIERIRNVSSNRTGMNLDYWNHLWFFKAGFFFVRRGSIARNTVDKIDMVYHHMHVRMENLKTELRYQRLAIHENLKDQLWHHMVNLKNAKGKDQCDREFRVFITQAYECLREAHHQYNTQLMNFMEHAYSRIWTVINHYKFNSQNDLIRRKMSNLKLTMRDQANVIKRNYNEEKRETMEKIVAEISRYLEYNIQVPVNEVKDLVKSLNQEVERIAPTNEIRL